MRNKMIEPLEVAIGELLRQKKMKLLIAESCTGGLLSHLITNVPGSSDYFIGGIVAYANDAKEKLLGVSCDTLTRYGAVSYETALEMARGIRQVMYKDNHQDYNHFNLIGISTTGVAGPGGGTPEKPVGLVWIGLSTPQGDKAFKYIWNGNRIDNKTDSAEAALRLLLNYLMGELAF